MKLKQLLISLLDFREAFLHPIFWLTYRQFIYKLFISNVSLLEGPAKDKTMVLWAN